jgi:hypothetical protein
MMERMEKTHLGVLSSSDLSNDLVLFYLTPLHLEVVCAASAGRVVQHW